MLLLVRINAMNLKGIKMKFLNCLNSIIILTILFFFMPQNKIYAEESSDVLLAYSAEQLTIQPNDTVCWVVDSNGCRINDWYNEESNTYFIFLTCKENIQNVVLNCNDNIISASSGSYDEATHMLTGAFSYSGDSIVLSDNNKNYTVKIMQSASVPSLYITLNGVSLDDVHKDKEIKYSNNSVYLTDPTGRYDLSQIDNVQFKGRENSSWTSSEKRVIR